MCDILEYQINTTILLNLNGIMPKTISLNLNDSMPNTASKKIVNHYLQDKCTNLPQNGMMPNNLNPC